MMQVGLTGGIGSGKTWVGRVFATLGIPVYSADDAAKRLMNEQPELRQALIRLMGPEVYDAAGLVRSVMAERVFRQPELLRQVNATVHPAVWQDFDRWTEQQTAPYVLLEAAVLFEAGLYRRLKANILVTAPQQVRLERVMRRDGVSEEAVLQRMDCQWTDERKVPLADYLIRNDDTQLILPQIVAVDTALRSYT